MRYNQGFKSRMVQRMSGPRSLSANALSQEVGVSQATLSRWLKRASKVPDVDEGQNMVEENKRPRDWSAEEKLRIVAESLEIPDEGIGAFLRGKGIHMVQLEEWRAQASDSLKKTKKKRRGPTPEQKRIKELERELARKDKALAEVTALLVLKKKAQAIWGDEDDDTPTRSGM